MNISHGRFHFNYCHCKKASRESNCNVGNCNAEHLNYLLVQLNDLTSLLFFSQQKNRVNKTAFYLNIAFHLGASRPAASRFYRQEINEKSKQKPPRYRRPRTCAPIFEFRIGCEKNPTQCAPARAAPYVDEKKKKLFLSIKHPKGDKKKW